MITYTLLPKLFLPIESRTVVILQVALAEIAAIALQFLLGEQTKAEPLIQQVAFAKLEILFANSIFLQTEPQTELQTEMDITICVPILSYMIFCLQIFIFNQLFSCSIILSLSPLPFVDSRSNGRE